MKLWASLGLAAALAALQTMPVLALSPLLAGGSNHFFYRVDPSLDSVFCRETFGIIANYHRHLGEGLGVRDIVQRQLAAMHGRGQRGVRVPILHSRGAFPGYTQLDSAGGKLNDQQRDNLLDFIADIGDAGFQQVLIGFFPQEANKPESWGRQWHEDLFEENWQLILSLHDDIVATAKAHGVEDIRFDLLNEGAPLTEQMQGSLDDYLLRLWQNYNETFGKWDTVGFSMIGWQVERYHNLLSIYEKSGYGRPPLYQVHFYDDFRAGFEALDAAMNERNDLTPWIIGETYYDDASVAADIAAIATNRLVLSIYQWGVQQDSYCAELPIEYRYFN